VRGSGFGRVIYRAGYRGAGRLRGEGVCWGEWGSSSKQEASRGEGLRPINRAGYRGFDILDMDVRATCIEINVREGIFLT